MTSNDWRSEAAYEAFDQGPLRDLAWEYLRRNPDYARDYERIAAEPDEQAAVVLQTWGLRFRRRSAPSRKQSCGLLVRGLDPSDRDDPDADPASRQRRALTELACAAG